MSTEQEFKCDMQLIKDSVDLDAGTWTQTAKDCTGVVTTTVDVKSKATSDFLNGVFEYERAETATMDQVFVDKLFGCEHDDGQGLHVCEHNLFF